MAKFSFEFQSVLNLKKQIETQEQMILGKLMNQLQWEEQTLEQLVKEEQKFINDFYKQNGQSVKAKALIELNHTIKFYNNRKKEQQLVVGKAKEAVIEQRSILTKSVIERKSYEKLREKAVERYQETVKSEENRLVDGIVSYQYK
jgi:flagellar FliJ protein